MFQLNYRSVAANLLNRVAPAVIIGGVIVGVPTSFAYKADRDIKADLGQLVPELMNRLSALDQQTASSPVPIEIFRQTGSRDYTVLATVQRALPKDLPAGVDLKGPCTELRLSITADVGPNGNLMGNLIVGKYSTDLQRLPVYLCPMGPQGHYTSVSRATGPKQS